jgi:hypothetical protein
MPLNRLYTLVAGATRNMLSGDGVGDEESEEEQEVRKTAAQTRKKSGMVRDK